MRVLQTRRFALSDQIRFAEFSGDRNPIHIDPSAARRTISGQCIVHGIHGLMWALDVLTDVTGTAATSLKARFLKPIFLEEAVDCIWNPQTHQLSISARGLVLTVISLKAGTIRPISAITTIVKPSRPRPNELTLSDCADLPRQPFIVFGNARLAKTLFPSFTKTYGLATAVELAEISEIVGMQVPGLHSLFLSLQIRFQPQDQSTPGFEITKSDERLSLLQIAVNAPTLACEIDAFVRPGPAQSPAMESLQKHVDRQEFRNVRALIVGGSRGLGEIAAKLIACGGGESLITYNVGLDEATAIRDEIQARGGHCDIARLLIDQHVSLPREYKKFNQLFYFATPKIFGKRSFDHDEALFQRFLEVYVHGFEAVCRSLSDRPSLLSVLYPSSVAIDKPVPELAEYIKAKTLGEEMCATLNNKGKLSIVAPRLPRIETDQTGSLLRAPSADGATVLLPLIREMTRRLDAE